jgi:predicted regulator of Ras-like GTPase activity (Roadblock/LC7/MglB family)
VQRIDQEELEFALAYLSGALPCKARGVVLVTPDGEVVGQYLRIHDGGQIASLIAAAENMGARMMSMIEGGEFRYALMMGVDGATLTMTLGDAYLLCLHLGNVRSLDALLNGVREGLTPLVTLLGVTLI